MLKFKKIELLTKTDKNPSVNQKKMLWHFVCYKIYDLLCWEEGDFFFWGGTSCLQLGRVEMRKKKEK